jgi:hypothetical protein
MNTFEDFNMTQLRKIVRLYNLESKIVLSKNKTKLTREELIAEIKKHLYIENNEIKFLENKGKLNVNLLPKPKGKKGKQVEAEKKSIGKEMFKQFGKNKVEQKPLTQDEQYLFSDETAKERANKLFNFIMSKIDKKDLLEDTYIKEFESNPYFIDLYLKNNKNNLELLKDIKKEAKKLNISGASGDDKNTIYYNFNIPLSKDDKEYKLKEGKLDTKKMLEQMKKIKVNIPSKEEAMKNIEKYKPKKKEEENINAVQGLINKGKELNKKMLEELKTAKDKFDVREKYKDMRLDLYAQIKKKAVEIKDTDFLNKMKARILLDEYNILDDEMKDRKKGSKFDELKEERDEIGERIIKLFNDKSINEKNIENIADNKVFFGFGRDKIEDAPKSKPLEMPVPIQPPNLKLDSKEKKIDFGDFKLSDADKKKGKGKKGGSDKKIF